MPRGSGKTTIKTRALIWAALNGHRRFPVLGTSDDGQFGRLMRGIKVLLEMNELLRQDFPEVVIPIRQLERVATKCVYQLYKRRAYLHPLVRQLRAVCPHRIEHRAGQCWRCPSWWRDLRGHSAAWSTQCQTVSRSGPMPSSATISRPASQPSLPARSKSESRSSRAI